MNKEYRLKQLIEKFNEGIASSSELAELENLLSDPEATTLADKLWENIPATATFFEESQTTSMLAEIEARNQVIQWQHRKRKRKMALGIAASLTIILSAAGLYLLPTKNSTQNIVQEKPATPNRIAPGDDKAILVLADGNTVYLEKDQHGNIPAQGNAQVTKINGQIVYAAKSNNPGTPVVYNTLKTPNGAQYQLQLADGSRVWMNAGSSLHFPASFQGQERKVELTGEAYFEIAQDAKKPFRVVVKDMQVNVLGTNFNIMAYDNEATNAVTLLEGSVNVSHQQQSVMLQPGQQAQSGNSTALTVLSNIDPEEAIAWKNGYFITNHTSLPVLMRQIERWYNVEVVYEGNIPNRKFGGKIPRKSDLQEVLKVLELSKVFTKLDGKKLTILDR